MPRAHWQLPNAVITYILQLLPPNERLLSGRLVCREANDTLCNEAGSCTASLGQPLPPHAAPSAVAAGQQHAQQLPFTHKLQLLCTAAASGSEVNLEVAWAVLQPSVFPELLQGKDGAWSRLANLPYPDPGEVAARAGHAHVLGWLVRHCPVLLRPDRILTAAAQHCDLHGLQTAWEALSEGLGACSSSTSSTGDGSGGVALDQVVMYAAAGSATPDAVAKMEWLLEAGGGSCTLAESTAAGAAMSGDVVRLQWLRDRGCSLCHKGVLCRALERADMATVRWLAEQGGCDPRVIAPDAGWYTLLGAAVGGPDAIDKIQWLVEQGAPLMDHNARFLRGLYLCAADEGDVEVARYVYARLGPDPTPRLDPQEMVDMAAAAGSVPLVELMHSLGHTGTEAVYDKPVERGNLAMVRWLVQEGRAPAGAVQLETVIAGWPRGTNARSRELLEVVRLLAGAGAREGDPQRVLQLAAQRGDLGLVQHLYERHVPPQPLGWKVLEAAAMHGSEALLEWVWARMGGAAAQGQAQDGLSLYVAAAASGNRGTLAALRRLGVPWGADDVLMYAVSGWRAVAVLEWMAGAGAPVPQLLAREGALELMAEQCGLGAEVTEWLRGFSARSRAVDGGEGKRTGV